MKRFDGFVLFAEMRTGSNFLEETLNLFPGLTCHGEAFNPGFVGHHNSRELFGMTRQARDADPLELMRRIFERTDGLGGFRFFHDHRPEVAEAVLLDPRVAKIVLRRNPLDAYVSLKIASATGQWRLTDERHRKVAKARFDAAEFEASLRKLRSFEDRMNRTLQVTGQTAFTIRYEQTADIDVLNGLAGFLGVGHRLTAASSRLKRQNPASLSDKVENFDEMQAALAKADLSSFAQSTDDEPRHEARVPGFVAASAAPLLFMPVKGGPTETVERWLSQVSANGEGGLVRGFSRKALRQWKNHNKIARSFTVVTHPVERAYDVFERFILGCGPGSFTSIRQSLRVDFSLPIPHGPVDAQYCLSDRRAAFLGYLKFVKMNLSGQTSVRSDPAFSSQASLVQSLSDVLAPDMVIRAEQLSLGLNQIGRQVGLAETPNVQLPDAEGRDSLARIYDDEIEAAARAAYNRDFMTFGYRRWKP